MLLLNIDGPRRRPGARGRTFAGAIDTPWAAPIASGNSRRDQHRRENVSPNLVHSSTSGRASRPVTMTVMPGP